MIVLGFLPAVTVQNESVTIGALEGGGGVFLEVTVQNESVTIGALEEGGGGGPSGGNSPE